MRARTIMVIRANHDAVYCIMSDPFLAMHLHVHAPNAA